MPLTGFVVVVDVVHSWGKRSAPAVANWKIH